MPFTQKQRDYLTKHFRTPVRSAELRARAEMAMKRTRYTILHNFLSALEEEKVVTAHSFAARNKKRITLYTSVDPKTMPPYELADALQPHGYFCNNSAVYFHKLTNQVPTAIYICFETIAQSPREPKMLSDSELRQLFLGAHRHTNFVFDFKGFSIVVVDRMKDSRFGVDPIGSKSQLLPKGAYVTCLERTLIDAVVSPQYNGGIGNVYSYFREAGRRIDMDRLVEIYRKLSFVYPYSQTIGFFMDRLGMHDNAGMIRKAFPPKQTFFVDHQVKASWEKDDAWNIYYPKGLVDED